MTFISVKLPFSEMFNIFNEENVNRCNTNDSVDLKQLLNNYLSLYQMLHEN